MKMALALGRRGMGRVWPNPAVGCVLVKDGRVIGRGWTADGGRPHAETRALSQAGKAASGATAYVTLEPCAHHGHTPPCAEALISAKVARVVIGATDPDARVAGRGIKLLREAGIEVETDVCKEIAQADHMGFMLRVTQSRPMVTLKLATSFDGRIATGSGQSQWITGSEARRFVHAIRSRHDVVLVGGGTARADDPSLTVRDLGISRQPVRVVTSRRLDVPLTSNLAKTATNVPLWLCHGDDVDSARKAAWQELGARLISCNVNGAMLDPADILAQLAKAGVTRVFCEGGGSLAASLLEAGLVDRLVGFTAGLAIGAEGLPSIGALGLTDLPSARRFKLSAVRSIGADIVHEWQA